MIKLTVQKTSKSKYSTDKKNKKFVVTLKNRKKEEIWNVICKYK